MLEDLDVYYFGKLVRQYPDIMAVCNNLMPDDVQRENSGTGGVETGGGKSGAEGAKADAQRRAQAKQSAKVDNAHVGNQRNKKTKREKEIKESAAVALELSTSKLGLPEGGLSSLFPPSPATQVVDAPSWENSKEGIESRAAKIDLSDKMLRSLRQVKKDIKEEEAKGPEADEEELGFLRAQVEKLREALNKDKEEKL